MTKVYAVPFVNPVTVIGEEVPAPAAATAPLVIATITYNVTEVNPSLSGAEKVKVAAPSPEAVLDGEANT